MLRIVNQNQKTLVQPKVNKTNWNQNKSFNKTDWEENVHICYRVIRQSPFVSLRVKQFQEHYFVVNVMPFETALSNIFLELL